jgi:isopenicillin N synthase-like dioxygenase
MPVEQNVVEIIPYEQLIDGSVDLSVVIEKSYGFAGMGILAIRGIPTFVEKRKALLPLAFKFSALPEEVKEKYVHPPSYYSTGWSHGKEKLEGKPDFSKGSFYANPVHDYPVEDQELIDKFPSFLYPNIWPREEMPQLEFAFKDLGRLIVETGKLLAKHIDRYVHSRLPTYPPNHLLNIISNSRVCKARLLNYFPPKQFREQNLQLSNSGKSYAIHSSDLKQSSSASQQPSSNNLSIDLTKLKKQEDEDISSWCGWHNDHGSLTGLTVAMFFDEQGNPVSCPDRRSGLYIRSRSGTLVKVTIPEDCLAFQIGETACIHSGGLLQATPHCVRASTDPDDEVSASLTRCTFAVFMEPEWHYPMSPPAGLNQDQLELIVSGSSAKHLPPGVPPLSARWRKSQDFGQFAERTLQSYY